MKGADWMIGYVDRAYDGSVNLLADCLFYTLSG